MRRGQGVRQAPLSHVIATSRLAEADPALAHMHMVDTGLVEHVVLSTRSSYNTACHQWSHFCTVRGLVPFPACMAAFCGWIVCLASRITVASIPM